MTTQQEKLPVSSIEVAVSRGKVYDVVSELFVLVRIVAHTVCSSPQPTVSDQYFRLFVSAFHFVTTSVVDPGQRLSLMTQFLFLSNAMLVITAIT